MKVQDYITKEMIDYSQSTRTEDGLYLHSNTGSKFCDILKQGLLTKEAIDEVIVVHKEMYDTRTTLLLGIKKESKKNGKSGTYLIQMTKGREEALALSHFKKTRGCLTEWEHLEVMNLIIKEQTKYPEVYITNGEKSFPKSEYSTGLKFTDYYIFLDNLLLEGGQDE